MVNNGTIMKVQKKKLFCRYLVWSKSPPSFNLTSLYSAWNFALMMTKNSNIKQLFKVKKNKKNSLFVIEWKVHFAGIFFQFIFEFHILRSHDYITTSFFPSKNVTPYWPRRWNCSKCLVNVPQKQRRKQSKHKHPHVFTTQATHKTFESLSYESATCVTNEAIILPVLNLVVWS